MGGDKGIDLSIKSTCHWCATPWVDIIGFHTICTKGRYFLNLHRFMC